MRSLIKTTAIVTALLSTNVYALGVGEIKLYSNLSQRLYARIPLFKSKNEDVSSVKVKLATPEKFDEAGILWMNFLTKIKFKTVIDSKEGSFIELTSYEALKEPFLNLLIEVYSSQGSMYREFTVLVDPPSSYPQKQPKTIHYSQKDGAVLANRSLKPRKNPSKSLKTNKRNLKASSQRLNQYGPTKSSDFIWKIAAQVNRYHDISIEQMIMALFKANPNAFYKDNVNALKKKQFLKIPEKQEILKLSKNEALFALHQQNEAWQNRNTDNKDNNSTASKQVKATPIVPKEKTNTAKVTDNKTKLVPEPTDVPKKIEATQNSSGENLNANSNDTNAVLLDKLNKVLSRLNSLEQQVGSMQKMLDVKDETIAKLREERKTKNKTLEETETKQQEIEEVVEEKPSFSLTIGSSPENEIDFTIKKSEIDEVLKQENTQTDHSNKSFESEDELNQTTLSNENNEIKPLNTSKTPDKKTHKLQKNTQTTDASDFLIDIKYVILAITSLFTIGLLSWFLGRRRAVISEPSSDISEESDNSNGLQNFNFHTDTDINVKDTGFLHDVEDFEAAQEHVDPITETDIYLNYTYYQQAEDLMLHAVEEFPDRDDCKLKLLEVFYIREKHTAFENYAKQLISLGKNNDSVFWLQVLKMGLKLNPESSLFKNDPMRNAVTDDDLVTATIEETETVETTHFNQAENEDKNTDETDALENKSLAPEEQAADELPELDLSNFEDVKIETSIDEEEPNYSEIDLSEFDDNEEIEFKNSETPREETKEDEFLIDETDSEIDLSAFNEETNHTIDEIEDEKTDSIEIGEDNLVDFELPVFEHHHSLEENSHASHEIENNSLVEFNLSDLNKEPEATSKENETEQKSSEDNNLIDFKTTDL